MILGFDAPFSRMAESHHMPRKNIMNTREQITASDLEDFIRVPLKLNHKLRPAQAFEIQLLSIVKDKVYLFAFPSFRLKEEPLWYKLDKKEFLSMMNHTHKLFYISNL